MYRLSNYIDNWLREINYRFRSKCSLLGTDYIVIDLPNNYAITLTKINEGYRAACLFNGSVIDRCITNSSYADEIYEYVQPSPSERIEALEALDKFLEDYDNHG